MEKINLRDKGKNFAFGIEGFQDKELKDDPRYVKMLIRLLKVTDGVRSETIIPHRKCLTEDWDSFADPTPDSKTLFQ